MRHEKILNYLGLNAKTLMSYKIISQTLATSLMKVRISGKKIIITLTLSGRSMEPWLGGQVKYRFPFALQKNTGVTSKSLTKQKRRVVHCP